jgi:hypothetical protein
MRHEDAASASVHDKDIQRGVKDYVQLFRGLDADRVYHIGKIYIEALSRDGKLRSSCFFRREGGSSEEGREENERGQER